MDFYVLMLCVLSTVAVSIESQTTGSACHTPNGLYGTCVPLRSCASLNRISRKTTLNQSDSYILRDSQCGSFVTHGPIKVCCPDTILLTPSYPTTTQSTLTRTDSTNRQAPIPSSAPIHMSVSASTPRISITKCNEYKELAYDKYYTYNVLSSSLVETKKSNCALTSIPTIVGGVEALPREFPHMALIGYRENGSPYWFCGGSLISDRFVLSAAHCNRSTTLYVRLGEYDLNGTKDAKTIDFTISDRFFFSNDWKIRVNYDIVLFKLNGTVQFTPSIRPACLPEQDITETTAIASGWGLTGSGTPSVLMKVELEIFSQNECNNSLNYIVCAGSHSQEKDTCSGDSGGPLQLIHKTHHCMYTVVGITSRGPRDCGTIGKPASYVKVHPYLDWIERKVWLNE